MRTTESLRNDHETLRAKLSALQQLLPLVAAPQTPAAQLTLSLAHCLRRHTEKEELLFGLLCERLPEQARKTATHIYLEHQRQGRSLLEALELLADKRGKESTELLMHHLLYLIEQLREHMAREEIELFPVVDHALTDQALEEANRLMSHIDALHPAEASSCHDRVSASIREEMTVNHVLRIHPLAREILRIFHVDCEMDGCACLEELAWKRGVDVEGLVLALNQAAEQSSVPVPVLDLLWKTCDAMMVIDDQRTILAVNPALEKLLGRSAKDLVGRNHCGTALDCRSLNGVAMSSHPERCPGLRACASLKSIRMTEYTVRTANGTRLTVSASYTPIQPSRTGPVWLLAILRDITVQKRRERRLIHQAKTDPLTRLPNRSALFEVCGRELVRAMRYGHRMALAILDLDGFKLFNDTQGHLAGDLVLRQVSKILLEAHRQIEFLARYGGDEFVILMPETNATNAAAAANRIRQLVAQLSLPSLSGLNGVSVLPPILTISVGVAVFPEDGRTTDALLAQADRRLYDAKRRGRNQVVGPLATVDVLEKLGERRRSRRVGLSAITTLYGMAGEVKGTTDNISVSGLHATLELPECWTLAPSDLVMISCSIPADQRIDFPFSRVEGPARVTRIEPLPLQDPARRRIGLAVEFSSDMVLQRVDATNGCSPHESSPLQQ